MDFKVLRTIFHFNSMLRFTPCYPHKIERYILCSLWIILQLFPVLWCSYSKLKNEVEITSVFLKSFVLITYAGIIINNGLQFHINHQHAGKLLKNIVKIDFLLGKKWYKLTGITKIGMLIFFYLVYIIFSTIFSPFAYNDITNNDFGMMIVRMFYVWLGYQKISNVLTMNILKIMLSIRYDELEKVMTNEVLQIGIHNGMNFDENMGKLKKILLLIDNSIKKINNIFGLSFLVITLNACASLLLNVDELLFSDTLRGKPEFWKILKRGIWSIVSIIYS